MVEAIIAHIVVDIPYLPRHAAGLLKRALDAFPVVVLMGARQTGKSTLDGPSASWPTASTSPSTTRRSMSGPGWPLGTWFGARRG